MNGYIIKRNGTREKIDIGKIRKQTLEACMNLNNVSYEELELEAAILFKDNMKTTDIQEILIKTALNKIDIDRPDWMFVAARLYLYDLYHNIKHMHGKNVKGDVYQAVNLRDYLRFAYDNDLLDYYPFEKYTEAEIEELNAYIDSKRDLQFTYLGIENFVKRYTLKIDNKPVELPQHLFMGVAMWLAQNEEDKVFWAKQFYDGISKFDVMVATPILSNGRRKNGQCFSCYVGATDDTLASIFDTYKEQSDISKWGGGIGWDWSKVRSKGGPLQKNRGRAKGKIPWLKIENDVAIAVDQLGVRKGSINVYCSVWDIDIFDFLDLKKSGGDERRTAEDLFISVVLDDVFLERVENNEDIYLFDPYDVPKLTETWGEEFRKYYLEYEQKAINDPESFWNRPVKVNAKKIMQQIVKYYWDKGMPFLFFKDNVNRANPHPELGIIRSSNLCTEICLPTSPQRTAVCNLGSVNIAKLNTPESIRKTVPILTRMLDNVIDLTNYVSEKSEKEEKRTRAIGIGIMGEAELLASKQIFFGSDEHEKLIKEIYEEVYNTAYEASKQLAKERGPWEEGKETRNAYLGAIAPTGTISLITGTSSCHEPIFARKWVEENTLGAFSVTAPNLNPDTYMYYVSAYEIDQKRMVELTAVRQKIMNKYLGQSISHNMYFMPVYPDGRKTSGKDVYETIMHAWKKGLKSLYYLRSKSLKDIQEQQNTSFSSTIKCWGCE